MKTALPVSVNTGIRIDREKWARFDRVARSEGKSRNQVISELVGEYVDRHQQDAA